MSLDAHKLEILKQITDSPNHKVLISPELAEDPEFILAAVKVSVNMWSQVSPKLRSNKPFILLAIEQNSNAFLYGASDKLRDDDDVAYAAVRKDRSLLFNVSDRLKQDESFKDRATKLNSWFPIIRVKKLLKNNLYEGIADTFAIMYGDYGIVTKLDGGELSSNRLKYGVVDLTLIPQISNALINYGQPGVFSTSNPFRFVRDKSRWDDKPWLRFPAMVIGYVLQAIRLGMALLATALVLPIVAFVHAIKFPYAYHQQSKLYALQGEICSVSDLQPISGITTFADFAKQTNSSLNDFCVATFRDAQETEIMTTSRKNIDEYSYGSLRSSSALLFFRPVNTETPAQKSRLQALRNLEINTKFDVNDFEDLAVGRSFI